MLIRFLKAMSGIIFVVAVPNMAIADEWSQTCGFKSKQSLIDAGIYHVKDFDDDKIKPFLKVVNPSSPFHEVQAINQHFESQANNIRAPWLPVLQEELSRLRDHPSLRSFKKAGLIKLNFVPTGGCNPICASSETLSIGIDLEMIDELYENTKKFRELAQVLLSHEIAHILFDINFWKSNRFKNSDEFYSALGELDGMKTHLVVDSIGAHLSNKTLEQFASLSHNVASSLGFEHSLSKSDVTRFKCLSRSE